MSSKLFNNLNARVQALEARYLPDNADPLGNYSEEQRDDARAFVLLSHAAIEEYLEQLSLSLSNEAVRKASSGEYDEFVCTFLSFWSEEARKKSNGSCLLDVVRGAVGLHRKTIGGNHGIKAKDVDKLFAPFYMPDVNLDPNFGAALDEFGARRGKCAHAGLIGANAETDLYEMHGTMQELMFYLKEFDSRCERFIAQDETDGRGSL